MTQINVALLKFTNVFLENDLRRCKNLLIALIDKIKCMYTSLMSLFGSITDQSQEYIGFLNIDFIMGP